MMVSSKYLSIECPRRVRRVPAMCWNHSLIGQSSLPCKAMMGHDISSSGRPLFSLSSLNTPAKQECLYNQPHIPSWHNWGDEKGTARFDDGAYRNSCGKRHGGTIACWRKHVGLSDIECGQRRYTSNTL